MQPESSAMLPVWRETEFQLIPCDDVLDQAAKVNDRRSASATDSYNSGQLDSRKKLPALAELLVSRQGASCLAQTKTASNRCGRTSSLDHRENIVQARSPRSGFAQQTTKE